MNERIRDLYEQAYKQSRPSPGLLEKIFAELIIREYGNIVLHYTNVDEGVKVANKHFGIEE